MNTIDVLSIIGKENDNIDSFSFHTFPKQILLQDKLSNWGKVEQAHFEKAMELREQLHLPFYDQYIQYVHLFYCHIKNGSPT